MDKRLVSCNNVQLSGRSRPLTCVQCLQAKKTKEVLSANTEAPLSVEELHNGIDFRSRITRQAVPKCLSSREQSNS